MFRSNIPSVKKEDISAVLRTFAVCNPEVGYCQGMNFIVGFLLLYFKEKKLSYEVLQALVSNYGMQDVFTL